MKYVPSPQALRWLQTLARNQSLATRPARLPRTYTPFLRAGASSRHFHATAQLDRIETHTLSDIGEGVKEVQIIQWFVEEGAPIEEWSPLCEVQSDKASVEITSKYSGVIKKIHFPQDAVVQVGDAMLDIEVEGDEDEPQQEEVEPPAAPAQDDPGKVAAEEQAAEGGGDRVVSPKEQDTSAPPPSTAAPKALGKFASLATPAVRGMLKEHGIAIEDITGTGKDGRVLKEDVQRYLEQRSAQAPAAAAVAPASFAPSKPSIDTKQTETAQRLTPIQAAMFKSMTGSLSIPHFLYSDTIDITNLASMRRRLNAARDPTATTPKLSYLPFIVKAVSLAMTQYPLLNARLDLASDAKKPQLMMRSVHNVGIAMDTPNGLVVPVVKAVNGRSIASVAQEIQRLAQLGQAGKLGSDDLTGGTITVSNIGNIGGEVVGPVIVEGQLAIMGIGKVKTVPVFAEDGVTVRPAQTVNLSWSADHRVVDGATMARMAQVVQKYLEEPGTMVVDMS
ncbi:2-oxoacid dehydrogenase acyltransferase catalytic domain-containing protein [Cladophialophora immunda]|nr:2-oxoacid dehydrogenase acyltransferase catalytic domain-containing protein [Cladophialophora immunda]